MDGGTVLSISLDRSGPTEWGTKMATHFSRKRVSVIGEQMSACVKTEIGMSGNVERHQQKER